MSNTQNIVHRIKTYLSKFKVDFNGDNLDLGVVIAIVVGALLGIPLIYLYTKQSKDHNEMMIALKSIDERLNRIERSNGSGNSRGNVTLENIAAVLGIKEAIHGLDYFVTPYVNFLDDVEKEIEICEQRLIQGPEYYRRSYMVKFALYMAMVYARVRDHSRIPKIEKLLERSKRI